MELTRLGPEAGAELAALSARCVATAWGADDLRAAGLRAQGLWEEGRLVAYAVLRVVAPEAEVLSFGVDPTRRRRGHGRRLLTACLAVLAEGGVREVFLEVRASNASALQLYEGAGFRPIDRRAGYYGDGEDALVLRRVTG